MGQAPRQRRKVPEVGRIVSMAVIVAVGVNSDGRREGPHRGLPRWDTPVLGMDVGPAEAETPDQVRGRLFWTAFLRKLARRGPRGVKLVISDAHEGIRLPSPS